MKKVKFLVLCIFCLSSYNSVFAQEGNYIKGKDTLRHKFNQLEYAAIAAVKAPICKMPTPFLTLEIEGEIWDGKKDSSGKQITRDTSWKETQSWQYFGSSFIANALFNTNSYRTKKGALDSSVCVAYVLGFANINEDFSNAFSPSFNKQKDNLTRKTIKTILKDKSYHEGIYQWLKPALVLAWKTMKEDVQNFFKGLIDYIKTFDYKTEKDYYESLKLKKEEYKFTAFEPSGKYDPRRKAKAWIFRRIYFDGWDFTYVLQWTKRFQSEIML